MANSLGTRPDIVVDVTSDDPEAIYTGLDMVRSGGRLVLASTKGNRPLGQFFSDVIVGKQISIIGALGASSEAYRWAARKLETDPTIIYGIGPSFDGDIRRRDLRTDTPYNTYTRHGLPPTPIAMPGRKSLFAAANPADGEELYFVADGKGGHTFSRTLAEHQAAVNRLLGRE